MTLTVLVTSDSRTIGEAVSRKFNSERDCITAQEAGDPGIVKSLTQDGARCAALPASYDSQLISRSIISDNGAQFFV